MSAKKLTIKSDIMDKNSEYISNSTLYKLIYQNNILGSLSFLSFKNEISISFFLKRYYKFNINFDYNIDSKDIFIENLYIFNKYRRSGFATYLLSHMIIDRNPMKIILIMSKEKFLKSFYSEIFRNLNYQLILSDNKLLIFKKDI